MTEKKDGPVYVISVPGAISEEAAAVIESDVKKKLGADAKVLVLSEGMTFGIHPVK